MVHFWSCLKDGCENFEGFKAKSVLKIQCPSLLFATAEISKQSQCSYLVLSKQTPSLFLSFH